MDRGYRMLDGARRQAFGDLSRGHLESGDGKGQGMKSEAIPLPETMLPEILRTPPVTDRRGQSRGARRPGACACRAQTAARPGLSPSRDLARSMLMGLALIGYTIATGIGVWGNNIPVAWAFDIINFVFWIGIGHAGTLDLRDPAALPGAVAKRHFRFAEAMTIFAVMCAGIFPADPRRAALAGLLALALSQPARHLAEFPLAADMGRVRRQHVLQRFPALLVPGPGARSGFAAGSHQEQESASSSTRC